MIAKQAEIYFQEGCGRCSLGGTPECKVHRWANELAHLRNIILDCGLQEDCKWGSPCYTFQGKNVTMLATFKEYCFVDFFNGALLKDTEGILVRQTENVQAGRQVRFTNVKEILALEVTLKTYIFEAIEVEKSGQKVILKKTSDFPIPVELEQTLVADSPFKQAWEALTPGRQRGYLLHFAAPKQTQTRSSRIEKCREKIFAGKGLQD